MVTQFTYIHITFVGGHKYMLITVQKKNNFNNADKKVIFIGCRETGCF